MMSAIDDLIEQIENSSESIKVDFFQEDDGEILSLTEYVNPESNNSLSVIAEYNNIDVINIDKKSQKSGWSQPSAKTAFSIQAVLTSRTAAAL